MGELRIKRIYAAPEETDGCRILVDRLWPRGLKKENARLDFWDRAVAPSTEVRKAFGHVPERFPVFQEQYRQELNHNPEAAAFRRNVLQKLQQGNVTLLCAAKDPACSNAAVLKAWLEE